MILMMFMVMIMVILSIEWECTSHGFSIPICCWVSKLTSTKDAFSSNKEDKNDL